MVEEMVFLNAKIAQEILAYKSGDMNHKKGDLVLNAIDIELKDYVSPFVEMEDYGNEFALFTNS